MKLSAGLLQLPNGAVQ